MEYMDGGCLTDILEQFDQIKMTEPQIAFCCREVLLLLYKLFYNIFLDFKSFKLYS